MDGVSGSNQVDSIAVWNSRGTDLVIKKPLEKDKNDEVI